MAALNRARTVPLHHSFRLSDDWARRTDPGFGWLTVSPSQQRDEPSPTESLAAGR